jgi:heat shock protein HslJ
MKSMVVFLAVIIAAGPLLLAGCQDIGSPLEDIDWVLTSFGRYSEIQSVLPDTEVTAFFNSEEKQVNGNAGCNSYFGSYEVDGLTVTITGPIAVTEMWCGEGIGGQEQQYLKALEAAESFRLDHGNLRIEGRGWQMNFKHR